MNVLLTTDKKENITATGENVEPKLGLPYNLKNNSAGPTSPYKALDKCFFSRQRKLATEELKNSRNFRTLLEVAEGYFSKGVLPQAQNYYKQALQLNPQLFLAYQRLKSIALKKKDFRALEENQQLLVINSSRRLDFLHEYVVMRAGLHPKDRSITEKALCDINEIIAKEPNNASFLNTRGFILLNSFQEIQKAESDFKKAQQIDPNHIDANNNLGVVLMKQNNYREAIQYFEVCISQKPEYQFSYRNLALCYISLQLYANAAKTLKKASANGITLPRNWQHLLGWLLLRSENFVDAEKWYKEKITEEPKNNLLYNNLGTCLLELKKTEDAIKNFNKAIDIVKNKIQHNKPLDPRDWHALHNRARIALKNKDRQTVNEIRKYLTKVNRDDIFAAYLEGNNQHGRGNLKEALEIYFNCIKLNPLLPDPYPDAAFILECHLQDYESAVALLETGLKNGIKTSLLLNNLAYAYIKLGKLDKAEEITPLLKGEVRPESYATQGLLNFYQGNLEEGDRFYALAIKNLDPQDKPMASQLWHYERALFFNKKGDGTKALDEAMLAKKIKNSYLDNNIQTLIDSLSSNVSLK